jgi:hypothetical protein
MGKNQLETIELLDVKIVIDRKDNTYAGVCVYRKGSDGPSAELSVHIAFGPNRKGMYRYVLATPHKYKKEYPRNNVGFEVRLGQPSPKHPPTMVSIIVDGAEVASLTMSIRSTGLEHHQLHIESVTS